MSLRFTYIYIFFSVYFYPNLLQGQHYEEFMVVMNKRNSKERKISFGKKVKIGILGGKKIKGDLMKATQQYLVIDMDTIYVEKIEWISQRVRLKPLGIGLGAVGGVLLTFGTVGFVSSIGSEDGWSQIGAALGALIGVAGALLDLVALPILLKSRRFRIGGEAAKWVMLNT